jgi:hypothetical protein
MSLTTQNKICPICYEEKIINLKHTQDGVLLLIDCERCGKYYIDRVLVGLEKSPWYEVKHLASAQVRRENNNGIIPIFGNNANGLNDISSSEWWLNQLSNIGFPETTNEKLDALLLAYAKSIDNTYGKQFSFGYPHFIADVAARNQEEVNGLNELLNELGYIDKNFPKITAKGWLRLDELRKAAINSNQAFVAMWFDKSTEKYSKRLLLQLLIVVINL